MKESRRPDDELFPMSIVLVLPPDDSVLITKKAAFFKIFVFQIKSCNQRICYVYVAYVLLCWKVLYSLNPLITPTYMLEKRCNETSWIVEYIHTRMNVQKSQSPSFVTQLTEKNWSRWLSRPPYLVCFLLKITHGCKITYNLKAWIGWAGERD